MEGTPFMEQKYNTNALFNIGYGLYVITSNDGKKHNAMIANTVVQLTSSPIKIGVTLNKNSYTHDTVKATGIMNVNCLSTEAPFKVFEACRICFFAEFLVKFFVTCNECNIH